MRIIRHRAGYTKQRDDSGKYASREERYAKWLSECVRLSVMHGMAPAGYWEKVQRTVPKPTDTNPHFQWLGMCHVDRLTPVQACLRAFGGQLGDALGKLLEERAAAQLRKLDAEIRSE